MHNPHYNSFEQTSNPQRCVPAYTNVASNSQPQVLMYPPYHHNTVTHTTQAISDIDGMYQYSVHQTRAPPTEAAHRTDTRVVKHPKPPYSYISLVCMAIAESSDKKATLREIIQYIENNFPYYQLNKKWHGSIRHNLTINDCFVKLARRPGCKSCHWTIDPAFTDMFDNGSLRRRRYRFKEGSQNWNRSKVNAISKRISKPLRNLPVSRQAGSSPTVSYDVCSMTAGSTEKTTITSNSYLQPLPSPDVSFECLSGDGFTQMSSPSPDNALGDLDDILNTINSYDQVLNMRNASCLL